VATMQKYASDRNIAGTMRTFRSIKQSGVCLQSLMYSIVLQAWINCGNVQAAEDWMEEITEAGMADEMSYSALIKSLVKAHAVDKATALMKTMRRASITPTVDTFNDVLSGFAREYRFKESLSLLDEMHAQGAQPSSVTLNTIVKLMNGSRNMENQLYRVQQILSRYNLEASINGSELVFAPLPRLAAVISQAQASTVAPCAHEMHITGSLSQMKAVRKTLKQHGFLDSSERGCSPLDGHWETDHGLTVVIEGKLVRWSAQRASRLRFTNEDRTACKMMLYGEVTNARLMSPSMSPDATKTLMWDNGDVWHSFDGRVIGQNTLFSQNMTKTSRDHMQDQSYRARSNAVLRCVSKQALHVPSILEQTITQFLGNDLYYVRVQFESKWNPSKQDDYDDDMPSLEAEEDICNTVSRRHPRIGLRHSWAEKSSNCCGQRTLVNGEEVDDDCFSRHVRAVCWA